MYVLLKSFYVLIPVRVVVFFPGIHVIKIFRLVESEQKVNLTGHFYYSLRYCTIEPQPDRQNSI